MSELPVAMDVVFIASGHACITARHAASCKRHYSNLLVIAPPLTPLANATAVIAIDSYIPSKSP